MNFFGKYHPKKKFLILASFMREPVSLPLISQISQMLHSTKKNINVEVVS